MRNPYRGVTVYPTEEGVEFTVTLFRNSKHHKFEDKVYHVFIEEKPLSPQAKVKVICQCKLDLSQFVDREASESSVPMTTEVSKIPLMRTSKKVTDADMSLTVTTQFIKEGSAMDEDMISIASLLSMQASQAGILEREEDSIDVGNLEDFDDVKQFSNDLSQEIAEIANQIGQLTAMSYELDTDLIPKKTTASKTRESDEVPKPTLPERLDSYKKIGDDIEKGDESKGDHLNGIPSKMNKEEHHPLSKDHDNDKEREDDDEQQTQGIEEEVPDSSSNPLPDFEENGPSSHATQKSRLLSIKSTKIAETTTSVESSSLKANHSRDPHVLSTTSESPSSTSTTILSRDSDNNNQLILSQRLLTFCVKFFFFLPFIYLLYLAMLLFHCNL